MSEDNLTIWIAGPDDLDEVMNLAMLACEDNALTNPNPIKLLQDIWPALNRENGLRAAIGEPGGKMEGIILLRISEMWYSDDLILDEKAIFIHPDYRQAAGGRARRLAAFAKKTSDTLGIPLVIGVLSNQRTAAKVRMYSREFGPPSGAYWIYNGSTGSGTMSE
jgi:hypothetical protein